MVSDASNQVYLLGLGGMGMAPLAVYLSQSGWTVAGQDRALSEPVRSLLAAEGVDTEMWNPYAHPSGKLVVSSAVSAENHMVATARERGEEVLRRGHMLARILSGKRLMAVAGSHGKSTTTAMLASAVEKAGIDAGYLVGGFYRDQRSPARFSSHGEWVTAELDESDGTMEGFNPELTVLTNLDWDHSAHYAKEADLNEAFGRLLKRTTRGVLVLQGSDAEVLARARHGGEVRTFGARGDYGFRLRKIGVRMLELELDGLFGAKTATVAAGGQFNAANAAAALAALHWMTDGEDFAPDLLADFPGLRRRQECLYEDPEKVIWEDYAHHPTEIAALLESLRQAYPGRRLAAVFQPHRYSRTRSLGSNLAASLSRADTRWLLPVYAAAEQPECGGTLDDLLRHFSEQKLSVHVTPPGPPLLESLQAAEHRPGPGTVIFIGAGDITEQAAAYAALTIEGGDRVGAWRRYLEGRLHPDCLLEQNATLHNKTTLRVGGRAAFYAEPANLSDLRELLRGARHFGLPLYILGRGSNLLVREEGFSGLVIRFQHDAWRRVEAVEGNRLFVGAGARLKDLAGQAARLGLSGFEFMEGIPGSLGGALRMNAGAMGSWMFDVVDQVLIMTADGELQDLKRSVFSVSYRNVENLKSAIAVGAVLRSPGRGESADIRARMQEFMLTRKASQPREPSAGCIFKNPDGDSAGRLLDSLGLKGLRVGDAEVSPVHANFIVNRGAATSGDVVELIREVRRKVRDSSGVELEPEVLVLGRHGEEVLKP